MTDNIFLRKTKQEKEVKKGRYEILGFTQNPFPSRPSIIVGNPDARLNGSIYLPAIRTQEQETFQNLLISKSESENKTIAFLMDYATRRGRGIGKTAFLNHQRAEIMKDLGFGLSNGNAVLFGLYIAPNPGGNYRKFWQFNRLIFRSLIEQDIVSMALIRLRAFSGLITDSVLEKAGNNLLKTIGNDEWLRAEKVSMNNLNEGIEAELIKHGIRQDLITALIEFGSDQSKFRTHYFSNLSDHFWRKDEGHLVFNDIVKLLTAAGFNNGILLADEVEKIILPQNAAERRAFTDAIRYFFIDGQCENTRLGFYQLFLTIHPYLQELVTPHWGASGLERFASLSGEMVNEYTVYFKPLTESLALPLAKAYLSESRLDDNQNGVEPFTEDALKEALRRSGGVPGKFLSFLHSAIEKCIDEKWEKITPVEVKKVTLPIVPSEPGELDQQEELPNVQVDLKGDD